MLSKEAQHHLDKIEARGLLLHDNASLYASRASRDYRNRAVLLCVTRAADLVDGATLLAKSDLWPCVEVVSRALYETLVHTRWVISKKSNAKRFLSGMPMDDLKRQFKRILQTGILTVHKENGEDMSDELLSDGWIRPSDRRLQLEQMADEGGMREVHDWLYGYMSMLAHGTTGELLHIISVQTGERSDPATDVLQKTDYCAKYLLDCAHQWMEYTTLAPPPNLAEAVWGRKALPGERLTYSFPRANVEDGTATP